ncbi:MAG: tetratricopeptide repeat protein [Phycisphaerales bacterium]
MSRSAATIDAAIKLFEAGNPAAAKDTLRRHLQRAPGDAQANKLLAMVHGALEEDDQAFVYISRAAALAPLDPEIQFMLGNVSLMTRKYKDGAKAFGAVAKQQPTNALALDGLAKCLLSRGDYPGAMSAFEQAITAAPTDPDTYHRLGTALGLIGRMDEALIAARRGLTHIPDNPGLLEFLAYNQNFPDDVDPIAHKADHARLGTLIAQHATRRPATFANTKDPERRLRVGFLSSDFNFHACAFFLETPLRSLDPARLEVFLYSRKAKDDEFSAKFKTLGQLRDVSMCNSDELATRVMQDKIDILIDCGGWTDRDALRAMEPRCAPVQATYLGYPNTTGVPSIDYRIIDAWTDPPGSEAHCTETLARMSSCFLCYRPWREMAPQADFEPPSVKGGVITFGSFNRPMKVGARAIDTWARVLKEVPGSRLLIKVQIASEEVGPAFISKFEKHGVDPSRIITADWVKKPGGHFPMYRRMDISLDPFPYNGTTTTCEALWMGVPVIALAGDTHRSRVGVSLLNTVGVPELIAKDADDYVRLAAALANDSARLATYHHTLRPRVEASPLVDGTRFARDFEACLRAMWRAWCGK